VVHNSEFVFQLAEAAEAIEAAKRRMPLLTVNGTNSYVDRESVLTGEKFEQARRKFSTENVATAIAFLRQCRKLTKPNFNSYGLKHSAERWGRVNGMSPYVANGELIAAACYLDFKTAAIPNNPNVMIAISRTDVDRLDPQRLDPRWVR
jgi:hypothetical protein